MKYWLVACQILFYYKIYRGIGCQTIGVKYHFRLSQSIMFRSLLYRNIAVDEKVEVINQKLVLNTSTKNYQTTRRKLRKQKKQEDEETIK